MTDTNKHPPKVAKLTDKITIVGDISVCQFPTAPNVSIRFKRLITAEFYEFIQDPFYHPTHIDFINNYLCSQSTNRRRPSTFHLYNLTKSTYQTWYNAVIYESYTQIECGKTYITLDFDENCADIDVLPKRICENKCPCVYNTTLFPIFKTTFNLFTNLLNQVQVRHRLI